MASDKYNKKEEQGKNEGFDFVFGRLNYLLLAAGLLLLALGYILLMGGGSDDPAVFNPAMFDNQRLVVAPLCIVLGLVVEIFAIMLKPKHKNNNQ